MVGVSGENVFPLKWFSYFHIKEFLFLRPFQFSNPHTTPLSGMSHWIRAVKVGMFVCQISAFFPKLTKIYKIVSWESERCRRWLLGVWSMWQRPISRSRSVTQTPRMIKTIGQASWNRGETTPSYWRDREQQKFHAILFKCFLTAGSATFWPQSCHHHPLNHLPSSWPSSAIRSSCTLGLIVLWCKTLLTDITPRRSWRCECSITTISVMILAVQMTSWKFK